MVARGLNDDLARLVLPIGRALQAADDPAWVETVAAVAVAAMNAGEVGFVTDVVAPALVVAEQRGDHVSAARCLLGLGFLDPSAESWRTMGELADRGGAVDVSRSARIAYSACLPGDLDDAVRELEAVLVEVREEDPSLVGIGLGGRANALLMQGHYDRARDGFFEALRLEGFDAPPIRLLNLAVGAAVALATDDPELLPMILEASTVRSLRGVPAFWAGVWKEAVDLAAHHLAHRELDLDQLVAVAAAPVDSTPWIEGQHLIGRELLERGMPDRVWALHDQFASSALGATPARRLVRGSLRARLAAAAGESDSAEQEWRDLLALAVEQGARPFAVDALEGLAVLAVPVSAVSAARLLGAAATARDEMRYRLRFPLEHRAVTEALAALDRDLGADGAAVALDEGRGMSLADAASFVNRMRGGRGRPSFGWDSLTPTERDVARLVAEGATNPDVGRKLLMSVNTAKTHLAHIFRKLGVASRAELAAEVVRHTEER
jgi:DNA-binding CsgD family transcriptional regulator